MRFCRWRCTENNDFEKLGSRYSWFFKIENFWIYCAILHIFQNWIFWYMIFQYRDFSEWITNNLNFEKCNFDFFRCFSKLLFFVFVSKKYWFWKMLIVRRSNTKKSNIEKWIDAAFKEIWFFKIGFFGRQKVKPGLLPACWCLDFADCFFVELHNLVCGNVCFVLAVLFNCRIASRVKVVIIEMLDKVFNDAIANSLDEPCNAHHLLGVLILNESKFNRVRVLQVDEICVLRGACVPCYWWCIIGEVSPPKCSGLVAMFSDWLAKRNKQRVIKASQVVHCFTVNVFSIAIVCVSAAAFAYF